ncbi:MAG: DUF6476 family protein [Paracoccus sp. (in: a-proteobacteria)]|uniref:DUF6476 family protein n=1 Tax=Paracoccus sp. TaxID=267 RepID=UPI0026DFE5DE|nr:DUF6476 family protein [Paracoccus sp. (in: a-proteobacteria)]MDO5612882.1 DUF6476 family protein [Paracoccus sp. (in: a-proteobacteria)]
MADDHNDWRETAKAVPELRFLRMLVTALGVVMGLGMIAIVAILWLRLGSGTPLPDLPAQIALPQGETAAAVTFARDWIVVVTDSGQVLLYDRAGALRDSTQP